MEDFNFQYVKSLKSTPDLTVDLDKVKTAVKNDFLANAIKKFVEISGTKITLNLINNWKPFDKSFFAEKKDNSQQIPIDMLGSGYEMIFSLLYSFYLSQQSDKQLIVFVDEPELHLHPSLQEAFVKVLLNFSKTAQIILTSHSPLFLKQLLYNENVNVKILSKQNNKVTLIDIEEQILPFISANEINYLAFGLPTEEHHNELYEEIKYLKGEEDKYKVFDQKYFITEKKEKKDSPWLGHPNEVSIHTFIRNQIHHQRSNGKPDQKQLLESIVKLRGFLKEINQQNATSI